MAYEVFIKIQEDVISKLPFLESGWQYLYRDNSAKDYRGILYEINESNYQKASLRLLGDHTGEITQGDKVFVMSGCAIPQFKIKDYLKSKGAVMTGDITMATKFVGNETTCEDVVRCGEQRTSALVCKMQYPRAANPDCIQAVLGGVDELHETDSSESVNLSDVKYNHVMVAQDVGLSNYASGLLNNGYTPKYFMTPLGAMILYNSLLRKVPIINDNHIFKDLEKTIIIEEDTFKSLDDMLRSKDKDNHKLAVDIIANSDIEKSLFWLWKLARDHGYEVRNYSQWKNVRLFLDKSNWGALSGTDAESFIEYMHGRHLLTKEYFGMLVKEAADSYQYTMQSPLFNQILVPSEKYKEYSAPEHEFVYGKNITTTEQSEEILAEYDDSIDD